MTDFAAQGGEAWKLQRCGRLTASRMAAAMDVKRNGEPGAARSALMRELLAEMLTGVPAECFVTADMQWGSGREGEAKDEYQVATGNILTPCGFIPHPTIDRFGASPDALLDGHAVFEAKCPRTTTHISWLLDGEVPAQHKPQILAQLACTKRPLAVFVSYDPRLPNKRLFIREWEPEADEIAAAEEAARVFISELDGLFKRLADA